MEEGSNAFCYLKEMTPHYIWTLKIPRMQRENGLKTPIRYFKDYKNCISKHSGVHKKNPTCALHVNYWLKASKKVVMPYMHFVKYAFYAYPCIEMFAQWMFSQCVFAPNKAQFFIEA